MTKSAKPHAEGLEDCEPYMREPYKSALSPATPHASTMMDFLREAQTAYEKCGGDDMALRDVAYNYGHLFVHAIERIERLERSVPSETLCKPVAWIADNGSGKTLHFAKADGWTIEAVQSAETTPSATPCSGWIPISERLPEPNGPDIFVLGRQFEDRCAWSASPGGFVDTTWAPKYSITHWMPMPEAPHG